MPHYVITLTLLCITALSMLCPVESYAIRESHSIPGDKRLKVILYSPNEVFKFTGHYTYHSIIEFSEDETIENISMGNSLGWQMVPAGHRLFLKPIQNDAVTNMTLITDRRMYFFELHAAEATGIDDPNLSFITRFIYSDTKDNSDIRQYTVEKGPDLSEPEKYNFNYTISGSEYISPQLIFDDGEFTYLRFRDLNADIPAFFLVDSEGKESLVNYHKEGDYIVIERVTSRFTLRNGPDVVCVFNERIPYVKREVD